MTLNPYPKAKQELSKSTFLKGRRCKRALYFHKHSYHLREKGDDRLQWRRNQGNLIGKLARQFFPGGLNAEASAPSQWRKSIEKTNQWLKQPSGIIYEAAFIYDGVLVFCDVLTFDHGRVHFYEVKSSFRKTPQHISDVALQYWVLSNHGFDELRCSLMTLNSSYVRDGALNLNELFKTEELSAVAASMLEETAIGIHDLKKVVQGEVAPEVVPGAHCFGSVPCDFLSQCWNMNNLSTIQMIPGLSPEQILETYASLSNGKSLQKEPTQGFTAIQKTIWNVQTGKQQEEINRSYFLNLFNTFEWPVAFYDVEWFMPPWPLWNGHKPFEHLPFLYSLLVLNDPAGEVFENQGYLPPGNLPEKWKPKALAEGLSSAKTLIVFDAMGEQKSFDILLEQKPEVNIVDMSEWLQQGHLIVKGMKGTLGLKSLTSFAGRADVWKKLRINGGYQAAMEYLSLFNATDLFQSEETSRDLIRYCREDTILMMEVFKKLQRLVYS